MFLTLTLMQKNRTSKLVDIFLHSDGAKLLAVLSGAVTFIVVIATAIQIWIDLADRAEERIDRAWSSLLRPAAGNTGKGLALNSLFTRGITIDGIDLSCRVLGNWDQSSRTCVAQPIFADIVFDKSIAELPTIFNVNFSWDEIISSKFDVFLMTANFEHAELTDVTISVRTISGTEINFQNASFDSVALRGNFSKSDFSNSKWKSVDVSGIIMRNLEAHVSPFERTILAWADAPPFRPDDKETKVSEFRIDEVFVPYGIDVLSKLLLCRPPESEQGSVIPLEERGILSVAGLHFGECETIAPAQAMREFPEAFVPKRTSFGW